MSKIKLFMVLILVGAIVFIASHLSLLRNYGHTLQVVNSVHLYSNNGRPSSLENNRKTKAKMKIVKSFRVHDNEEETLSSNITVKLIDRDIPQNGKQEQKSVDSITKNRDQNKGTKHTIDKSSEPSEKSANNSKSEINRKLQVKLATTESTVHFDEIQKTEKVEVKAAIKTTVIVPSAKSNVVDEVKENSISENSNNIQEGNIVVQKEEQPKDDSEDSKEEAENEKPTAKLPLCAPKGVSLGEFIICFYDYLI